MDDNGFIGGWIRGVVCCSIIIIMEDFYSFFAEKEEEEEHPTTKMDNNWEKRKVFKLIQLVHYDDDDGDHNFTFTLLNIVFIYEKKYFE